MPLAITLVKSHNLYKRQSGENLMRISLYLCMFVALWPWETLTLNKINSEKNVSFGPLGLSSDYQSHRSTIYIGRRFEGRFKFFLIFKRL